MKVFEPIKSPFDSRSYRVLRLSSGLSVLLISDPDASQAAASMDVYAGQFQDPEHVGGLAHFCEHMLFLGTEKFPDENAYADYVSTHGGMSNAFTSDEHTNFHFQVNADAVEGALDRFAQFFISPLFTPSATERELKAVHSEFTNAATHDGWRSRMILKTLFHEKHPMSKFGMGNLESLQQHPQEKGTDVRAELLAFHKTHYVASNMALSVLSSQSLEELQRMVLERFDGVPVGETPPIAKSIEILRHDARGRIVQMVPVQEKRSLTMYFVVPKHDWEDDRWKTAPLQLLSHLIGHEGQGSIAQVLKSEGLISELQAGVYPDTRDFACLIVDLTLSEETDACAAKRERCVAAVERFLSLLRETPASAWKRHAQEHAQLRRQQWQFASKSRPIETVVALSGRMHRLTVRADADCDPNSDPDCDLDCDPDADLRHVLQIDRLTVGDIDDTVAQARVIAAGLSVRNDVVVMHVSPQFENTSARTERWFGTAFEVAEFAPKLCGTFAEISLPLLNRFVAENVDVVTRPLAWPLPSDASVQQVLSLTAEQLPAFPVELESPRPECVTVWHKADDQFALPKTVLKLALDSPVSAASQDAVGEVLSLLLASLWRRVCESLLYEAELAGLRASIRSSQRYGMEVTVSGFSDKLALLVTTLLETLRAVADGEVRDETALALSLEELTRELNNFDTKPPFRQSVQLVEQIVESLVTHKERAEAAAFLTSLGNAKVFDMLRMHCARLCEQVHMTVLVVGNTTSARTRALAESAAAILRPQLPPASRCFRKLRDVVLQGETEIALPVSLPSEANSCVTHVLQVARVTDDVEVAKWYLLSAMAGEHAFDQLRTKETLGYVVFCGLARSRRHLALRTIVQSSGKDAAYLQERIEAWLALFHAHVAALSPEQLRQKRIGAVTQLLKRHDKLQDETDEYWKKILRGDADFGFARRIAATLFEHPDVTQASLVEALKTARADSTGKRRRLSLLLQSQVPLQQRAQASDDANAADSMLPAEQDMSETPPQEELVHAHSAHAEQLPPAPKLSAPVTRLTSWRDVLAWRAAQPLL